MKRRDFIKASSPLLALPFMVNGMQVQAFARTPEMDDLTNTLAMNDRVLVLVQLNGGNDGLNTVVPLDQLSTYNSVRGNVALPESSLLRLNDKAGLHPALKEIHQMFGEGKGVLIQGVTYPQPNQSHFRSTDIWMSGSDSTQYLSSGWAGRYLTGDFPNYPKGYPNATFPDPPAIQIGSVMPLALMGPSQNMGLALTDPTTFYTLINATVQAPSSGATQTIPGKELEYVRQIEGESRQYSATIKAASDKVKNQVTYPTAAQNSLAVQLQTVARLIAGGLKTRIYVVSIGGFDTHALQVEEGDKTQGAHTVLLGRLSQAVKLFYDDLKALGAEDRVLTMTFSEFGRRVESNASFGTDHGTAAPMFVFGTKVKSGMIGTSPSLTDLDNRNLKMQFDYRQIYASVLMQWLGANDADLTTSLLKPFTQVPIINTSPTSVDESVLSASVLNLNNTPNPVSTATGTRIRYTLPESSDVQLRILDVNGREIAELASGYQSEGSYEVLFNPRGLSSGMYLYELRAGRRRAVSKMVIAE